MESYKLLSGTLAKSVYRYEQFNWYKNHVSKQLDYITYKIRLHHIQNIQTQNQYSATMKGVKSRVLSFLLNAAILETQTISNGRLF